MKVDINERIKKAIELSKKDVPPSSMEFQRLLMGVNEKKDREKIRKAFQTGVIPENNDSKTKEYKQNDLLGSAAHSNASEGNDLAEDIMNSIKNNIRVSPAILLPNEDATTLKKSPSAKQENPIVKPITCMQGEPEQNFYALEETFPEEWKQRTCEFSCLMFEYCKTAFWGKDNDAHKQKRNQIYRLYPQKADTNIVRADKWIKAALNCYSQFTKETKNSELNKKIQYIGGPLRDACLRFEKNRKEQKQKRIAQQQHIMKIKGLNDSQYRTVVSLNAVPQQTVTHPRKLAYRRHPNDITGLTPCSEWTLFVDESGNSQVNDFATDGKAQGIVAGVLMSNSQQLPHPLYPGLHAATDDTEERIAAGDKLIENLIHHQNCGVLALPIKALRSSRDWGGAIGLLIDLVMRLLPTDGKTNLNVLVEEKEDYDVSDAFSYIRDACYYQLMLNLPAKAENLKLSIGVMKKNNVFNPYPDFVANSCLAHSGLAQKRLKVSKWNQTCFLQFPPEELAKVLDFFYSGKDIRTEDWSALLDYDEKSGQNFISGILDDYGHEVKKDIKEWERCLNCTVDHLNSKNINLPLLEKQINWLMDYQPNDSDIPEDLNLTWWTSKLAAKNHNGGIISEEEENNFRQLIQAIYPENSQLACWATLHLAVAMTDSFDFDRAKRIICDYYDVRSELNGELPKLYTEKESHYHTTPMVIPGIKYYAQMLSSYGQHEAFVGNLKEAEIYLRRAIKLFESLSDKQSGNEEIPQTLAYLVIVLMDMPNKKQEFDNEFARYFKKTPVNAVKDYVSNIEKPYYHHILLRAIADNLLPAEAKDFYFAEQKNWQKGRWHPWELIEFYRGVLCENQTEKIKHMRSAYEIAIANDGATLRAIGCGILGAMYFYDQSVKTELKQLTEQVIKELPKLGSVRIAAMRGQIETPVEPIIYIKKVLPFNFR